MCIHNTFHLILISSSHDIQFRAIDLWGKIECDNEMQKRIVSQSGGIGNLVALLRSKDVVIASYSASVLQNFFKDQEFEGFRDVAAQSGLIAICLDIVNNDDTDEAFLKAIAGLIADLSVSHYLINHVYMKRFELLRIIGKLLLKTDEETLLHAALALDKGEFFVKDMFVSDCFSRLVPALESKKQDVVLVALSILKKLSDYIAFTPEYEEDDECVEVVFPLIDDKTLSALCNLLKDDEQDIAMEAATLLDQIIRKSKSKIQTDLLLSSNFVEVATGLFLGNSEIVQESLSTLTAYIIRYECKKYKRSVLLENNEFMRAYFASFFIQTSRVDDLGSILRLSTKNNCNFKNFVDIMENSGVVQHITKYKKNVNIDIGKVSIELRESILKFLNQWRSSSKHYKRYFAYPAEQNGELSENYARHRHSRRH
jgi:hypothetical protein